MKSRLLRTVSPMTRRINSAILIALLFLMAGCATNDPMDSTGSLSTTGESTGSIAIAIPDSVKITERATYIGPGDAIGASVGGAIGGLLAEAIEPGNDHDAIDAYMSNKNIHLGDMFLETFLAKIKSNVKTVTLDPNVSSPILVLEVKTYGFEKGWGWRNVKPILKVKGRLLDANGGNIWQKTESVSNMSNSTEAYSLDEWLSNEQRYREQFQIAIDIVSSNLAEDLAEMTEEIIEEGL